MRGYASLTKRGKLARLQRLAVSTMREYAIPTTRVSLHRAATNSLYRVGTSTGARYMLRLATPGWRDQTDLQAEASWLDALARDTDIPVPGVIRTVNGNSVLPMTMAGSEDTWFATLMTWQPGRLLTNYLTTPNLQLLGGLFARLHIHGKRWPPADGFNARTFEHFLARGEPYMLFGKELLSVYTPHELEQVGRLCQSVESAYSNLDRHDLRIIHCDLWHGNVLLHRGALYPFDFEDTVWGFRVHDLAMAMLDLLEEVGNKRYHELLEAVRGGYEDLLDWPDSEMAVFRIGRLLWKLNYVARLTPQHLRPMLNYHVPIVDHFERTGELRLPED